MPSRDLPTSVDIPVHPELPSPNRLGAGGSLRGQEVASCSLETPPGLGPLHPQQWGYTPPSPEPLGPKTPAAQNQHILSWGASARHFGSPSRKRCARVWRGWHPRKGSSRVPRGGPSLPEQPPQDELNVKRTPKARVRSSSGTRGLLLQRKPPTVPRQRAMRLRAFTQPPARRCP